MEPIRNETSYVGNTASSVRNIYPDEQEKLNDEVKAELELSFKIDNLLNQYGYVMEATLVNGMPEIRFSKA